MARRLQWGCGTFMVLIALIVFVPAIRTELLIVLGLALFLGFIVIGSKIEGGGPWREAPTRSRRARDVNRGDGTDSP
ncbi:hypothetical protein [Streptomyces tsukubensis]|uniref:hypothetical protein n=1 Tax=Streptomyces tsukubensis TaxID=83656 RepID=UPI00344FD038